MYRKTPSLLWSLHSDQAPGYSYLLGTMHVRDSRAFRQWARVTDYIAECEVFAAEINLDELLAAGFFHPNIQGEATPSFRQLLTDRQLQKLRRSLLRSTGIDISSMLHLPPLFVAQVIDEQVLSSDYPASLDQSLWNFAKAQQKTLLGLEAWQQQVEWLQQIPIDRQLQYLLDLSRHISRRRKQVVRLATLYEKGEVQKLYHNARKGAGALRKPLLLNRNQHMARRISDLALQQPTFAAIGAAHLGGGKGVLRILKHLGFRLQPLQWQ